MIICHTKTWVMEVNVEGLEWQLLMADLNCAQTVSLHLHIVRYIKNWNFMWKLNEFIKSAIIIFCAFWHLSHCYVMLIGRVMGHLSGRRSIFKSCKGPPFNFNFVFCNACASILLNLVWVNRSFCNFSNSTLTHSNTHNSVKRHHRAMEEVSKTVLFMHSFNFHIFQVLICLIICKCTDSFYAQFILYCSS